MRILSWNINRGQKPDAVIEFLRDAKADVILLQESDVNARRTHRRNVAREIAQALASGSLLRNDEAEARSIG